MDPTTAHFRLSAFGDEIADDLARQVQVLAGLGIGFLELRGAWGKNVLQFSNDEVTRVRDICAQQAIAVSAIGSPIGKSPLTDPIENEIANLERIFGIVAALGTHRVRVFSFYPPQASNNEPDNIYIEQAVGRLTRLADRAAVEGIELLLENEKGIVGDTVARCQAILDGVGMSNLRFAWDPANFVQVGERHPTDDGWPALGPYTAHIHVKDALLNGGAVKPAGEGDGQIGALLTKLRESGYQGFLALEPHLTIAGHSSGFSGVDGMTRAVNVLRRLMVQTGCLETPSV